MFELDVPEGWQLCSLSQLGTVGRGRSRHRPRHDPALYGGPYPFVQTGDVKSSQGRITAFSQTYNERGLSQSRLWPANTLCITIAANIAETGILTFPACFPDSVVGFIADQRVSDVRFVEYMFRFIRRLIHHSEQGSGSVQDNINLDYLGRLRLPFPPLAEQRAIAEVLGALDDKVELNRQMNHTLEEMASALFKSWFVDFDPVVAKADGRKPFGMDAATAALFPSAYAGDLPAGWTRSTLGAEFHVEMGQSPPGSTYNEVGTGLPFYQGSTDFGARFPSRRVHCTAPTRLAEKGDTLLSVRAPVGALNIALEACAIGRGVGAVRARHGSSEFTLQSMRSLSDEFAQFDGEGTVFGAINGVALRRLPVIRLPAPVVDAFDRLAAPWGALIEANELESRTLTTLRDTLLPKLLSGEIRLKQATQLVEAAL